MKKHKSLVPGSPRTHDHLSGLELISRRAKKYATPAALIRCFATVDAFCKLKIHPGLTSHRKILVKLGTIAVVS